MTQDDVLKENRQLSGDEWQALGGSERLTLWVEALCSGERERCEGWLASLSERDKTGFFNEVVDRAVKKNLPEDALLWILSMTEAYDSMEPAAVMVRARTLVSRINDGGFYLKILKQCPRWPFHGLYIFFKHSIELNDFELLEVIRTHPDWNPRGLIIDAFESVKSVRMIEVLREQFLNGRPLEARETMAVFRAAVTWNVPTLLSALNLDHLRHWDVVSRTDFFASREYSGRLDPSWLKKVMEVFHQHAPLTPGNEELLIRKCSVECLESMVKYDGFLKAKSLERALERFMMANDWKSSLLCLNKGARLEQEGQNLFLQAVLKNKVHWVTQAWEHLSSASQRNFLNTMTNSDYPSSELVDFFRHQLEKIMLNNVVTTSTRLDIKTPRLKV